MRHLEAVLIAAVLALLLLVVTLDLTGHGLFVVTGGSMEPAIASGTLVIVRPTVPGALAVGDVVTYQHKGSTLTHRIAAIDEYGDDRVFTTKGDANEAADPDRVSFDDRVGLLVAQIPLAGHVLGLLQAYGRIASLTLALVLAGWLVRGRRPLPFPAHA